MSDKVPILILSYKRYLYVEEIFRVLNKSDVGKIYINIDGPKSKYDIQNVENVKRVAKEWSNTMDITIFIHEKNLGIRKGIPNAINKVFEIEKNLIIIEEDAIPSHYFYNYANNLINARYLRDFNISHISFYNCVPLEDMKFPEIPVRLSFFPESYAWGTSKIKWRKYSDKANFKCLPEELLNILQKPRIGEIIWKLNYKLTKKEVVDTWAYRWLFSIWNSGEKCLSVNTNLVEYRGFSSGTHTLTKQKWNEIPIGDPKVFKEVVPSFDPNAENYIVNNIFNHNLMGVFKLVASIFLRKLILRIKKLNFNKAFCKKSNNNQ